MRGTTHFFSRFLHSNYSYAVISTDFSPQKIVLSALRIICQAVPLHNHGNTVLTWQMQFCCFWIFLVSSYLWLLPGSLQEFFFFNLLWKTMLIFRGLVKINYFTSAKRSFKMFCIVQNEVWNLGNELINIYKYVFFSFWILFFSPGRFIFSTFISHMSQPFELEKLFLPWFLDFSWHSSFFHITLWWSMYLFRIMGLLALYLIL